MLSVSRNLDIIHSSSFLVVWFVFFVRNFISWPRRWKGTTPWHAWWSLNTAI
jgi:hypothetical protein